MIRLLMTVLVAAVAVVFALSNPQPAHLALWPTDYSADVPVSLALLAAMGVAFLAGALIVWPSALIARRRAGKAENRARMLAQRLRMAEAQRPAAILPPPG